MKKITIVGVLRDSMKRLSSRDNWCRGTMQSGNRMCLLGTVRYVASGSPYRYNPVTERVRRMLNTYASNMGYWNVVDANDAGGYEVAKKILRKALKRAER